MTGSLCTANRSGGCRGDVLSVAPRCNGLLLRPTVGSIADSSASHQDLSREEVIETEVMNSTKTQSLLSFHSSRSEAVTRGVIQSRYAIAVVVGLMATGTTRA